MYIVGIFTGCFRETTKRRRCWHWRVLRGRRRRAKGKGECVYVHVCVCVCLSDIGRRPNLMISYICLSVRWVYLGCILSLWAGVIEQDVKFGCICRECDCWKKVMKSSKKWCRKERWVWMKCMCVHVGSETSRNLNICCLFPEGT